MEKKTSIAKYILNVVIFLIGFGVLMMALDISFFHALFTALGLSCIFVSGINLIMFAIADASIDDPYSSNIKK